MPMPSKPTDPDLKPSTKAERLRRANSKVTFSPLKASYLKAATATKAHSSTAAPPAKKTAMAPSRQSQKPRRSASMSPKRQCTSPTPSSRPPAATTPFSRQPATSLSRPSAPSSPRPATPPATSTTTPFSRQPAAPLSRLSAPSSPKQTTPSATTTSSAKPRTFQWRVDGLPAENLNHRFLLKMLCTTEFAMNFNRDSETLKIRGRTVFINSAD
ncbi:PREDICTED: lysine-rich arabinogalactan protein 19-like, partial [Nicrophorus vespilloides]|uniref:Lysine-rich arabinogalactan protein 19-like n=1 Tax=Nicrophorus vespilloides TaxID=110193 RepID=A0ABM1ML09_NICVS